MYKNLLSSMKKHGVTKNKIADKLNIDSEVFSNKVSGTEDDFTFDEARKIKNEFFPSYTLDDLFRKEHLSLVK